MVAADSVLLPVQAAYLPVKGLQQLIKTISMVKRRLNRRLMIEGILLTIVDFRTNYAKDISSKVRETYGTSIPIFESVIPVSVKAAEASAEGISIYLSLEERGSIDILEEGTKEVSSGKESKAVIPTKPAKEKTIDEVSKKSIHARLQEKKNELAKKPGKDNPQRGVELA